MCKLAVAVGAGKGCVCSGSYPAVPGMPYNLIPPKKTSIKRATRCDVRRRHFGHGVIDWKRRKHRPGTNEKAVGLVLRFSFPTNCNTPRPQERK